MPNASKNRKLSSVTRSIFAKIPALIPIAPAQLLKNNARKNLSV